MVVVWEVASTKGLKVREGSSLRSKLCDGILSCGTSVCEIEVDGTRLRFKSLANMGPKTGWVSITEGEKALMKRTGQSIDVQPGGPLDEVIANMDKLRLDTSNDVSSVVCSQPFVIADPLVKGVFSTNTFHVSCRSDKIDANDDYAGMILWSYEGKQEWKLNGIRCKTGYIYIRRTKDIEAISSQQEQVHGKLYKSLFKQDYTDELFATGFSFHNGQWKFRSSLNRAKVPPSRQGRAVSGHQAYTIFNAVMHWQLTGKQNLDLSAGWSLRKIKDKFRDLPRSALSLASEKATQTLCNLMKETGLEKKASLFKSCISKMMMAKCKA